MRPGLLPDGLNLFDEGVAVGDERLETRLVVRAGAVRTEQQIVVGEIELRSLFAPLILLDVPASIGADHFLL